MENPTVTTNDGWEVIGPDVPATMLEATFTQAELDAAVNDALERAAKVADGYANKYWRPLRMFRTQEEADIDDGKRDCAEEIAAAIRALKP